MLIYRLTNKINGKVYIGQTVKTLSQRLQLHNWSVKNRSKQAIHCAIRKYEWENFLVEQVYQARNLDELNAMETFFIILHQSFRPQYGYNRTRGGYRRKNVGQVPWNKGKRGTQVAWNKGKEMPESFREQCRTHATAVTAAHARTFIKPQTLERRKKIAERFTGENNPFFGQTHTPATRAKMRAAKLRRIQSDPNYKNELVSHFFTHS